MVVNNLKGVEEILYFDTSLGMLNKTMTYTLNDISIDAYGFLKSSIGSNDIPAYLYGKTGTGEDGLGLANDPSHEINKLSYIQLDLSNVINIVQKTTSKITVQHIQPNEGFTLYGSNKLGELGNELFVSADNPMVQTVEVPLFGTYQYISITASGSDMTSNVILNSISFVAAAAKTKNMND
jgi:hypothetical protein